MRRLNRSAHTDTAHCPCPWRIAWAGQQKMRKNVALLKCHDMRSGPNAIQRELHRPKGGTGMLLSNGDLRTGSTNTGCSDGVLPGRRHLLGFAKTPGGTIQWPHVGKDDRFRHCLKEPV